MTEKSPNHPSMRATTAAQEGHVTAGFREVFMDLVDAIIDRPGTEARRSTRSDSHPSQA